jgi:hypothetical protein
MLIGPLIGLPLALPEERLLWLAGSILLYLVSTNLAWAVRPFTRRVRWSPTSGVVVGVARFAYHVGMPYAALLSGVVTLESLGLITLADPEVANAAVIVTAATLVLVGLIGWQYRRQVAALVTATVVRPAEGGEGGTRKLGWGGVLFSVVTQETHWAFYRALAVLIVNDPYVGSFGGLGLILLEAYTAPQTRGRLRYPVQAEFLVLNAIFAVLSTVLFVLTGTSWLAAGAHLTAAFGWLWFVHNPYQGSVQET